jgi:hypothetical protein
MLKSVGTKKSVAQGGENKAADDGTAERRVLAGLQRHRDHADDQLTATNQGAAVEFDCSFGYGIGPSDTGSPSKGGRGATENIKPLAPVCESGSSINITSTAEPSAPSDARLLTFAGMSRELEQESNNCSNTVQVSLLEAC